mmetsp:Transcript_58536/g.127137  ORF Transcript_58536/g.127137 Transcript_58536/m.127137 type:complete len:254 (+) Transcript_58536:46-807(+)
MRLRVRLRLFLRLCLRLGRQRGGGSADARCKIAQPLRRAGVGVGEARRISELREGACEAHAVILRCDWRRGRAGSDGVVHGVANDSEAKHTLKHGLLIGLGVDDELRLGLGRVRAWIERRPRAIEEVAELACVARDAVCTSGLGDLGNDRELLAREALLAEEAARAKGAKAAAKSLFNVTKVLNLRRHLGAVGEDGCEAGNLARVLPHRADRREQPKVAQHVLERGRAVGVSQDRVNAGGCPEEQHPEERGDG